MSSVFFDPAVGGNGSTVSDDADPDTGLQNYGHVTRFVPALQQLVAIAKFVIDDVTGSSDAAAQSAAAAADSERAASASETAAAASEAATAADAEAVLRQLNDIVFYPQPQQVTVEYDGNGLLIKTTETLPGNQGQRVTVYTYQSGRIAQSVATTAISVRTETYGYDASGRVNTVNSTEVPA